MYFQREPIGSNSDNRIWSILTVENAIGAATGGGVMYGLAQVLGIAGRDFGPGFWVQAVMIIAGMAMGAGATVRVRGLSLVDRISLFVGFQIQKLGGQNRIDPPIEASIWALSDESDDLLPLLDEDMLAALEAEHGRA